MVDLETARDLCLALTGVTEHDHFGKAAYRVKKRIFATLNLDRKLATVQLPKDEQARLSEEFPSIVFPVDSAWAKYGWTHVDLEVVGVRDFTNVLTMSWNHVATKNAKKKKKASRSRNTKKT